MSGRRTLVGAGITAGHGRDPDVIRDVDVSVEEGAILCLVGPNGAGKSTLMAVLAGVLPPRAGTVTVDGVDVANLTGPERGRLIGYLPQSVQPFTPYTAGELVSLGRYPHARGLGFETDRDRAAVARAMALTRIDHLVDRPFDEISGGERQRVLIASVLSAEPQVLLLDEPTASLDIGQRSAVFTTLKELARRGAAIAVVTHDLNLAGLFADSIALLSEGSVAARGTPAEVIHQANLARAYGDGFELVERPGSEVPGVLPAPGEAP
jgi:iron complex transport system ATP-binding protein